MQAVNPATGALIRDYPEHSPAQARARLDRADEAYRGWRERPVAERAARLGAAARVLRADRDRLAALATDEMGKTLAAAAAEVEKCASACDWYAAHAAELLSPRMVASDASRSLVRYDPLGVVLAVMPWNFPYWQAFRCAVPALAAGNTVALKHASNVPGCALAIEEVFRAAEFPEGAFTTLLVPSASVAKLIDHPAVRAVSLTGSESAGVAIALRAGANLKKSVLELGGSDAFLVLDDADPEAMAREAAAARLINNGQSCIAAKRFIVAESLAERFEAAFAARLAALRVGDPRAPDTDLGPLARLDLVRALEDQVRRTVEAGARVLVRGGPLPGPGFFYAPTALADVTPGMAAFDEETFGPLAAVTRARDDAHAVELANHSRYGLGASVWTRDPQRGERLAARLEAGSVFVNGAVKSDPRLPFGGIKRSGWGRELSVEGLHEFVNIKTVWVR